MGAAPPHRPRRGGVLIPDNYRREGRNAERIAADFAGDARLHAPRVF